MGYSKQSIIKSEINDLFLMHAATWPIIPQTVQLLI